MSSSATTSKSGTTFLWVLGAFASFAVLFLVIQTFAGKKADPDPRAPARLEMRQKIAKTQGDLVAKMGLNDKEKTDAIFARTVETLAAKKPGASTQVVPGSPTQLKQAAAAAAAAPPPPPAPAPAAAPAAAAPAIK